jgi:hypothetical protein
MLVQERNKTLLVVHFHGLGFEHEKEVAFDAAQLEYPAKFQFFAYFAFFDERQCLGVKRQYLACLDRVCPRKVGHIQQITPGIVFYLLVSTSDIPRQRGNLASCPSQPVLSSMWRRRGNMSCPDTSMAIS